MTPLAPMLTYTLLLCHANGRIAEPVRWLNALRRRGLVLRRGRGYVLTFRGRRYVEKLPTA